MALRLDPAWWIWPLLAGAAAALGALAGYDPKLAIAAALGIAFVALVLADLTVGLVLFTVLSFLALLPTFGGSALSLPKLAGLLLAMSWLATTATRSERARDLFAEHAGLVAVLLAFVALTGLSVIWAESHGDAITAFSRYALNLSLFPIVYSGLRRREHALWIATAFVGGATIAAAYGFVTRPNAAAASSPGIAGSAELDRVSGTVGDPNELAAVLVAGVVLATALLRAAFRSPALRLAAFTAATLCLLTVFLTLSRGGLIALAVALLAGMLLGGRWRPTYALIAVATLLSAFAYFGAVASPQDRDRLTKADGGTGRTDIWKVGWRIVEAKPALGAGAGNFPAVAVHYVLRPGHLKRSDLVVEQPQVTHNTYLQILAELGVVGLALFLAIVGVSVRAALGAARSFSTPGRCSDGTALAGDRDRPVRAARCRLLPLGPVRQAALATAGAGTGTKWTGVQSERATPSAAGTSR